MSAVIHRSHFVCRLVTIGLGRIHQWYATVELERLGRDPVWLDKAIRIVDRLVREANGDKKGKRLESPLPGDASLN